jgi:endonuclease G
MNPESPSFGYAEEFLSPDRIVAFPDYSYFQYAIAKIKGNVLDYCYYSVVQHGSRRLPLFSASNIFRLQILQEERSGDFKKDNRISPFEQLGDGDYSKFNSIKSATIDKGHMTKREDVQWDIDSDSAAAKKAAESTFVYPNAAPQHARLNRRQWKRLENSVMIKGRIEIPNKVSVFTGPVLDQADPFIISGLEKGGDFQIPVLFWKIIYYIKLEDHQLCYAGFLMGQNTLLEQDHLIQDVQSKGKPKIQKPFLEFEDSNQYQVSVSFIEKLTNLRFQLAIDKHSGKTPLRLEDVQVKSLGKTQFGIIDNINV